MALRNLDSTYHIWHTKKRAKLKTSRIVNASVAMESPRHNPVRTDKANLDECSAIMGVDYVLRWDLSVHERKSCFGICQAVNVLLSICSG